jgi:hypothetical protein
MSGLHQSATDHCVLPVKERCPLPVVTQIYVGSSGIPTFGSGHQGIVLASDSNVLLGLVGAKFDFFLFAEFT